MRFSLLSLISKTSLHNIFVGNSAAVAAVLCLYADVAAVLQAAEIAAYRAFGYVQRVADLSLWNNYFTAITTKIIKNEVQQFAGYGGIYIPIDFVFG